MHVGLRVRACMHVNICTRAYKHVCVHLWVCVCTRVRVCVGMYAWVHVCVCTSVHSYVHVPLHLCTCARVCTYTRVPLGVRTFTCASVCTKNDHHRDDQGPALPGRPDVAVPAQLTTTRFPQQFVPRQLSPERVRRRHWATGSPGGVSGC